MSKRTRPAKAGKRHSPRPTPRRRPVPTVPKPPAWRGEYYPELAEWVRADPQEEAALGDHVFQVDDQSPDAKRTPIFTVTVDPAFSPEMATKIIWMIVFAPDLWRELLAAAPMHKVDGEPIGIEAFGRAEMSLRQAASRRPFAFERPDESEDRIRRFHNCIGTAQLTVGEFNKLSQALRDILITRWKVAIED